MVPGEQNSPPWLARSMRLFNAERTAQGLDGTPAEFESQLDPATEEQRARPCPVSGVVEDEGSCRAGGPWRRGENMPLNLNSPKGRWGRWDHRAEEFLQGWNSW